MVFELFFFCFELDLSFKDLRSCVGGRGLS